MSVLGSRANPRYMNYIRRHYHDIRDQVIDTLSRRTSRSGRHGWPRWRRETPEDFTRRVGVIIQHVEFQVHHDQLPVIPPGTPPQEGQDEYDD